MPKLNGETIDKAVEEIRAHIGSNYKKLIETYNTQPGALNVSLSMKFTPCEDGIAVDTGITYVTEKIKESSTFVYDPDQKQLF